MPTLRFCIVIPLYNESGNVVPTLERVNRVLKESGLQADILCVNDGSSDATGQELARAASRWANVMVRSHTYNQGFGAARWTGMQAARGGGYAYVRGTGDGSGI